MIQENLYLALKSTNFPVAYSHFKVDNKNPHPKPPYITYIRTFDNNISSDLKVHGKEKTFQIELYTSIKDLEAERKIEEILNQINPEYETSEEYIEEEQVYQIVYTIKLIEKR